MSDRHNMTLKTEINTAEGDQFFDATLNYYGLRYDQMAAIQAELVGSLGALVEIAKQEGEARKESGPVERAPAKNSGAIR